MSSAGCVPFTEVKVISEERLVRDGKDIGTITIREDNYNGRYYHVAFQIGPMSDPCSGLAQGFGSTEGEAVTNAFEVSRTEAQIYLQRLEALEAFVLGGEQQ